MLFQGVDPFPDCVCEAEAIIIVSYMFASMITMITLIVLMLYFYMKVKRKMYLRLVSVAEL